MVPDDRDAIANLDVLDPDPLGDRTLNGSTMTGTMPMTYAPTGTMMYLIDVDRGRTDSSWPQSLLRPLPSLPLLPPLISQTPPPLMNGTDAAAAMRMAVTIRWLIRYVAKMPTASLY
jgi:hypothetical protein